MASSWSLESDLDTVLDRAADDLALLDGRRLFITGGTGFIGGWLLNLLHRACAQGLRVEAHLLTRDAARFAERVPHLAAAPWLRCHEGDVTDVTLPGCAFDMIFHAATDASAKLNAEDPGRMFDTALLGTRQVLRLAAESGAERFLMLSSGAVYGRQPWEVEGLPESWTGGPDCTDPVNTYAEAKRGAEMLCAIAARQGLGVSIARIFALLGPGLELNAHFAAGNFLSDAMSGRTVTVNGDGRAVRSYLYPTDLLVQLLALWVRGPSGRAYNVGSPEGVSIRDLAETIARLVGTGDYAVLGKSDSGWNPGRYVPDMTALHRDLGVEGTIKLDQAVLNTAQSYGWTPRHDGARKR